MDGEEQVLGLYDTETTAYIVAASYEEQLQRWHKDNAMGLADRPAIGLWDDIAVTTCDSITLTCNDAVVATMSPDDIVDIVNACQSAKQYFDGDSVDIVSNGESSAVLPTDIKP